MAPKRSLTTAQTLTRQNYAAQVTPRAVGAIDKMNLKNEIMELLDAALESPAMLDVLVPKLQQTIWDDESDEETPELEILRDLAYDLEYYVSDPDNRKQDPSYYGPERALEEIMLARKKLTGLK